MDTRCRDAVRAAVEKRRLGLLPSWISKPWPELFCTHPFARLTPACKAGEGGFHMLLTRSPLLATASAPPHAIHEYAVTLVECKVESACATRAPAPAPCYAEVDHINSEQVCRKL